MEPMLLTRNVILSNLDTPHDHIYYSSNEKINPLISHVDIEGKKVYSVLGSSDQVFHISNRNPKSIDAFDINGLSIFYYYLRRWSILYLDKFYPNVFSHKEIEKILKYVEPSSEEERDALLYWEKYLKHFSEYFTKYLFFKNCNPTKNTIKDLKHLKESLLSQEFHFHHMDISKERLPKKFNFIFLSNIPEYYDYKDSQMERLVSNIDSMLEDDGEVVTSSIMNLNSSSTEIYHFYPLFSRKPIFDQDGQVLGSHYKKRVLKRDVN